MGHRNKTVLITSSIVALALGTTLIGCSGGSVDARLDKASAYRQKGKLNAEKIELKNILQEHPKNARARRELGELYLKRGKYPDAVEQLQRARKLGKNSQKADVPLAKAFVYSHEYKKALAALKNHKASDPTSRGNVWSIRGEAYLGLKKKQKAKHAFDQALAADADSVPALIGRAGLAHREGQNASAQKYLKHAVESEPKNPHAWLSMGNLRYASHHFEDATKALQKALDLSANSDELSPQARFYARARLTDCQYKLGRTDKAAANAKALMKKAPKNGYANYLQALNDYRQENYTQAVEHLQTSLNAIPGGVPALTLLGLVKAAQGDYATAEHYLSKVIARVPENLHSRETLAKVYMQEGQPDQAVKTLRGALAKHGSDPHLLALLAKASMRAGEHEQGVQFLKQSAEHSKGNTRAQVGLAQALVDSGDSDAALRLIKATSLKDKSDSVKAERVRIAALLRKGKKAEAVSAAQALAKQHTDDPQVLDLLGSTYLATGRGDEAGKTFRRALQLAPDDPRARLDLGLLALRGKDPAAAEKHFQAVLDKHPHNVTAMAGMAKSASMQGHSEKTLQWLQKAHKENPDAVAVQVALIRHYLRHNRGSDALPLAEALVERSPDNAGYYQLSGLVKMSADRPKQAIQDFQKAVNKAPKVPAFQLNLALAELADKQDEAGIGNLKDLRQAHPDYLPAARELALVQLNKGDTKAALDTARGLRENNAAAAYALEGDLRRMQGKHKQAARAYSEAYQAHPGRQLALRVYQSRKKAGVANPEAVLLDWQKQHPKDLGAAVLLAEYYQSAGKLDEGAAFYQKVLRADADNALALNNLAIIYQKQDDHRALDLAERAHKAAPGNASTTDTLGWLLVTNGRNDRGLRLLQQAAKAAPKAPEIHYHYAVALARDGQKTHAKNVLTQVLASRDSFTGREQAEALNRKLSQGTAPSGG